MRRVVLGGGSPFLDGRDKHMGHLYLTLLYIDIWTKQVPLENAFVFCILFVLVPDAFTPPPFRRVVRGKSTRRFFVFYLAVNDNCKFVG